MKFSVLLSIYNGTSATEFSACLESISYQTFKPFEIVIVFDGPVDEQCRRLVERFSKNGSIPVVTRELDQNSGLGIALKEGLEMCRYGLVARMDSDDVCILNRFELQCKYLEQHPEISVVGGALLEKYVYKNRLFHAVRSVPTGPDDIGRVSRLRNPMNHPTVMFRKSDVKAVGGYLPFLLLEDYYLWARMLLKGYQLGNLPDVLVKAGADTSYFERRGGREYFEREKALTRKFREMGFHNRWTSLWFLGLRWLFRMVPVAIRARLYPLLLRTSSQELKDPVAGQ